MNLSNKMKLSSFLIKSALYILISITITASSFTKAQQPDVFLEVNKAIVPFNEKNLLPPQLPGAKEFPPLGFVSTIGTILSAPHFFSASFNIYTREGSITDIKLQPKFHCLKLLQLNEKGEEIQCYRFEFNLTQLAPPLNTFNPNKRTIILVPGYLSGDYVEWTQNAKNHWLQLEDVNVILVHWSEGNSNLYDTAMANVKLVARQVTILLYYLSQLHNTEVNFEDAKFRNNIHLVGHSLGAHISGYVGQEFNGQVGRITGLDPAGPIFDTLPNHHRLDSSDAKFVDIIHTNAGRMHYVKAGLGILKKYTSSMISKLYSSKANLTNSLLNSHKAADDTAWFGIRFPIGHIDYYANGGSIQPGCNDEFHLCDHSRAVEIYNSALEHELWSRRRLGEHSELLSSGQHRLVAFSSPSYDYFKTGQFISSKCPHLFNSNVSQSNCAVLERSCLAPIDFVARGEDIYNELKNNYKIDLVNKNPLDEEEGRYYFETLSSEPLVGEHFLLRMYMPRQPEEDNKWTRGCKLLVQVNSNERTDLFAQLYYDADFLTPLEIEDFHGLALPIVNPVDWRKQVADSSPLDDIVENSPIFKIDNDLSEHNLLKLHVAHNIQIALHYTSGRLRKAIQSLSNFLKFTNEAKTMCQLAFSAIEVRPLAAAIKNISSWYFTGEYSNLIVPEVESPDQLENEAKEMLDRELFRLNSSTSAVTLHLRSIGFKGQILK